MISLKEREGLGLGMKSWDWPRCPEFQPDLKATQRTATRHFKWVWAPLFICQSSSLRISTLFALLTPSNTGKLLAQGPDCHFCDRGRKERSLHPIFLFRQSPGVLEGAFYKPSSIVGQETKDGGAGFKHNDVSSSMQKNPAERPPLLHTHTKKRKKGGENLWK